jgi:hypothetical protein
MRLAHGDAQWNETLAQYQTDIVLGGAVLLTYIPKPCGRRLSGDQADFGRSSIRARAMG